MQGGICDRAPFEAGLLAATSATLAAALSRVPLPGTVCGPRCRVISTPMATPVDRLVFDIQFRKSSILSSNELLAVHVGVWGGAAALVSLTALAIRQELHSQSPSAGAARPWMRGFQLTQPCKHAFHDAYCSHHACSVHLQMHSEAGPVAVSSATASLITMQALTGTSLVRQPRTASRSVPWRCLGHSLV